MDSNRDDSRRCLHMAKDALAKGDTATASRLLDKSRRMFPIDDEQERVAAAIRLAQSSSSAPSSSRPTSRTSSASAAAASPRPSSSSNRAASDGAAAAAANDDTASREATPEMKAAVRHVLSNRTKSHYEILDVPRDADEAAIKRAYRRHALRLHPDRNSAPGADEAFKRLSAAFYTLSDASRRSHYDITGDDEPDQPPVRRRGGCQGAAFTRTGPNAFVFQNGNASIDELFEFLFANQGASADDLFRRTAGNTRARTRRPRAPSPHDVPPQETRTVWEQLRPILTFLVFLALSAALSASQDDSISFSMVRSARFPKSHTSPNGTPFFVSNDVSLSGRKFREVALRADRTRLDALRAGCSRELDREQYLRAYATGWFVLPSTREAYRQELKKFDKVNCQRYKTLAQAIGYA